MKKILIISSLFFLMLSCKKEEEVATYEYQLDEVTLEVNDFIWKAMNTYYLWKEEIPVLADDYFEDKEERLQYLDQFPDPAVFFESLIYDREHIDRWSWIVDDYVALQLYFQGVKKSTGMRIGLVYEPGSSEYIFAYVRYVLPDSDAENKGMERGNVFRKINGERLTVNNYRELLNSDVLNIELADWNGSALEDTGVNVELVKTELNENPVYITKVLEADGKKIGYLMYNGFTYTYNTELNNAFAYFKNENIDELVVDLRYNPGGSVSTMQYLASMITGQFNNEIFLRYQWNQKIQNLLENNYPDRLYRTFTDVMDTGESLNQLYLNKVHIIATSSSASASESLINCLRPYIDVVQFGTTTHGKYTASVTLYDSPDFSSQNVNPDHTWAIQPIVLKISNVNYESDFINGLEPDYFQRENYADLGVLGDENEPMLHTVLEYISGDTSSTSARPGAPLDELYFVEKPFEDNQYIDQPGIQIEK